MLKDRIRDLGSRARAGLEKGLEQLESRSKAIVRTPKEAPVTAPGEEPPVVARMIVEVRSDGARTVARGAVEDVVSGERVAIEAQGTTPAQLAGSLAKSLFTLPLLARQAVRSLREPRPAGARGPRDDEAAKREREPAADATNPTADEKDAQTRAPPTNR